MYFIMVRNFMEGNLGIERDGGEDFLGKVECLDENVEGKYISVCYRVIGKRRC